MIEINEKYKTLYDTDNDTIIITGGRGSGKSFVVADWACRLTYQPNETILYTRYTLTSAKHSIIPEYKDKIDLFNAENHFNITENEIVNKLTGSKILFKGIKNASGNQTANLKSIKDPTKWICDEAAEIPDYDTFQKIKRSLRKKGATIQTVLVLNPESTSHWIYKFFFEELDIPDYFNGEKNGITYIHTDYINNIKNLDKALLNDAEATKERNLLEYNNIFLGQWGDYQAIIPFPKSSLKFYSELPEGELYVTQSDPADGGDYFASIICLISDKKIFITDVIFNKNNQINNLKLLSEYVLKHNSLINNIEINKGGSIVSETLNTLINNKICKVYGINETMNKEYRINVYADTILERFYFKKDYKKGSEYDLFIQNLTTYSNSGKNKNDDAPDVCVGLVKFLYIKKML